ncbi:MAG: Gfo/Idh/MocA family oxidoreductase [Chloroflexota bacterium]
MKWLIAGLGSIGRRHLRNLRALSENDIVLYRTHQSTMSDEEFSGLPVETDLGRALDLKPDAVIVSNPTALHLEVAIPAAEAGCHILMEKPISHSLDGVDILAQIAGRSGSRILIGFQFRFHPTLQKAKEILRAGSLGRVLSCRAHWGEYLPNWHPWEDYKQGYAARADLGGGVVLTLCHPLDYIRMLLGEVDSLWAFTSSMNLRIPVEDAAEIGIRFSRGAIGSVHLNYNQRPPAHRLEIVGSNGTLQWDTADGILRYYQSETQLWQSFPPPTGFERNTMFMDELSHFTAVAQGIAEPVCTLEDGRRALVLALGVHESAASSKLMTFHW